PGRFRSSGIRFAHFSFKKQPIDSAPQARNRNSRRTVMARATNLPPISVTTTDFDRLRALAQASTHAAEFLAREIDRARLIEPEDASDKLETMNARVRYRDDVTGQERAVTLVYPNEAD